MTIYQINSSINHKYQLINDCLDVKPHFSIIQKVEDL